MYKGRTVSSIPKCYVGLDKKQLGCSGEQNRREVRRIDRQGHEHFLWVLQPEGQRGVGQSQGLLDDTGRYPRLGCQQSH